MTKLNTSRGRAGPSGTSADDPKKVTRGTPSSEESNPSGVAKHFEWIVRGAAIKDCGMLIDIGCGHGAYDKMLTEHGIEVVGIDLDFAQCEPGSVDGRVHKVKASAAVQPFNTGAFGVAMAIEVLEHVDDLEKTLAEIHRILMRGGRLIATVPNRGFPFLTHSFKVGGRRFGTFLGMQLPLVTYLPRPILDRILTDRCFTARDLERVLSKSGFNIEALTFMMPAFDGVLPATSRIPPGMRDRIRRALSFWDFKETAWFGSTIAVVARKV